MYLKRIIIVISLLGIAVAMYFAYFVYHNMFVSNTTFNNEEAYIYIPTNSSYSDVREQLSPLLIDMESFDVVAERKKYVSNVKPGHFIIKRNMNNNDIINSIRSNNIPIKVSFNNQETLEDLAGRIAFQIEADSTSLIASMKETSFLNEHDFTEKTALGMYIPNSYEFFWNTSSEQFRDRMLIEYNRFWNETRLNKAKLAGLSPQEVMTLASIVQKETSKVDERPLIAGVYINRMNKGIPLQADPTIIFAIKDKSGNFNQVIKRVLFKDLELDSPYNTYKYAGLPPGLITMPDLSSIEAVLNYEKHNYYYFVADTNRLGYHKFSKTLSQHNRNREEYLRWISKQGIRR